MPARSKRIIPLIFFTLLLLSSCVLDLGGEPAQPTVQPTVTPPSDMLTFRAQSYTYNLEENIQVPGTKIVYRNSDGQNINFDIAGQPSVRRVGDVINGKALLVPGVYGDYNFVLNTGAFSGPRLTGEVVATVFNPAPKELLGMGTPPPAQFVYDGITVDFRVPVGKILPGTSVVYTGRNNNVALLSGTVQYSNLPEGNSFVWTGQLRPNTIVQYDLKAVAVTDTELRMTGSATLYLYSQPIASQ